MIVDLAAETGGNCELTEAGRDGRQQAASAIVGPLNLPASAPMHASEMYARNVFNFLELCVKDGALTLDWDDELIAKSCLSHAGETRFTG